jgi:hypothetical protein
MNITIEDFRTGWFGLGIGITDADIEQLIKRLQWLRESRSHFHFRSGFQGEGGVADVEVFWTDEIKPQNMTIE